MRETEGKKKAVANELKQLNNVEVIDIDVGNDDSVQNVFEKSLLKHGRIDVLINNAGEAG